MNVCGVTLGARLRSSVLSSVFYRGLASLASTLITSSDDANTSSPTKKIASLGLTCTNMPREKVAKLCVERIEKADDAEEALNVLGEMKELGIRTRGSHYLAALTKCVVDGQWKTALDLLREADSNRHKLTLEMYNAAIRACRKGNQCQHALICSAT